MIVSTRGRYALRVMVDLAEQNADTYIPLRQIAERQNISQKYMEAIMAILSKGGLVEGAHGKGGGYKLTRRPEAYKVKEILLLTEGSLAPVSCMEKGAPACGRSALCRTLPMWKKLDSVIMEYLDSVSVADLMEKK